MDILAHTDDNESSINDVDKDAIVLVDVAPSDSSQQSSKVPERR
jgi:hypothetical protein